MSEASRGANREPLSDTQVRFMDFVEQRALAGKYKLTNPVFGFPSDFVLFQAAPGTLVEPSFHEVKFKYREQTAMTVVHGLGGYTMQKGAFWVCLNEHDFGGDEDERFTDYPHIDALLDRLQESEETGRMRPVGEQIAE